MEPQHQNLVLLLPTLSKKHHHRKYTYHQFPERESLLLALTLLVLDVATATHSP